MKSAKKPSSRSHIRTGVPLPVSFLRNSSKHVSKNKKTISEKSRAISKVRYQEETKAFKKEAIKKRIPKVQIAQRGSKFKKSERVYQKISENLPTFVADKRPINKKEFTKNIRTATVKKPRAIKPVTTLPKGLIRLEKHMAQSGMTSRREAQALIRAGLVMVNKTVVRESGFGIDPITDKVTLKTNAVAPRETIIINKPRGIETTATSPDVVDIIKKYPRFAHLSPVGRLDKNTDGLILLTNDGTLTKYFTGSESLIEKEYLVRVRETVLPEHLARMARGIKLDKVMTLPTQTVRADRNSFTIILREGRKHQIRRMCDACQLTVEALTRIRIGHIKIGKMTPGNFKVLSETDIRILKNQD